MSSDIFLLLSVWSLIVTTPLSISFALSFASFLVEALFKRIERLLRCSCTSTSLDMLFNCLLLSRDRPLLLDVRFVKADVNRLHGWLRCLIFNAAR